MKVEKNKSFTPFDITITVESKEEAQALYAIFNYTPNCNLLSDDISIQIRHTIGNEYSVTRSHDIIANGIDYEDFYGVRND